MNSVVTTQWQIETFTRIIILITDLIEISLDSGEVDELNELESSYFPATDNSNPPVIYPVDCIQEKLFSVVREKCYKILGTDFRGRIL